MFTLYNYAQIAQHTNHVEYECLIGILWWMKNIELWHLIVYYMHKMHTVYPQTHTLKHF